MDALLQMVAEMENFADVADRCALTEGNAPVAMRAWAERLRALSADRGEAVAWAHPGEIEAARKLRDEGRSDGYFHAATFQVPGYAPLYAATPPSPAAPSGVSDADALLSAMGLDPERFRTEAGFINHRKVVAAIKHPADYAGLYLPGTEYAWLIENGKQVPDLRYRTIEQGIPVWTDDHMKAIRFARREDAEMFAAEDDEAWAIVEHGWEAAQPQPGRVEGPLKLDTDSQVFFYEQDFYVLSNFSSFSLEWKGQRFATSEAAYHWEKFDGTEREVQEMILDAPSAHEAFKIAESQRVFRRHDWDDIKVPVMREILRAKVAQHEYVRRKLLATGSRELIENSWRDDYWGWGPNRDGRNVLGKLWMEIRAELVAAGATP